MLLDPPALKTKSHGASEAAKRMIEHQLAPNRRANNLASKKESQSNLRDMLEKKRKKPEAKNGRDDGPSNKRQRRDDGPVFHGPVTNCTFNFYQRRDDGPVIH